MGLPKRPSVPNGTFTPLSSTAGRQQSATCAIRRSAVRAEIFREPAVANPSHARRKDGPLTPSFTGPPLNLSRSAVTRSDAGVTSSLDNSRRRSPRKPLRTVVARLLIGPEIPLAVPS